MKLSSQVLSDVSAKFKSIKLYSLSSYKYPLIFAVALSSSIGLIYSIKCYRSNLSETEVLDVENIKINNEKISSKKSTKNGTLISKKTLKNSLHSTKLVKPIETGSLSKESFNYSNQSTEFELFYYLQTSFSKIEETVNQIIKESQKRSSLFTNFLKVVVDNSTLEMDVLRAKLRLEKGSCQWIMAELPVMFMKAVIGVIRSLDKKGKNSRKTKELNIRLELIVKSSRGFSSMFGRMLVILNEGGQYSQKLVDEIEKAFENSLHLFESTAKGSVEFEVFKMLAGHSVNCFEIVWLKAK